MDLSFYGSPQKIIQGQMTSSPCAFMCFLSIVVQYCGLSECRGGLLWTVANKFEVSVNGI